MSEPTLAARLDRLFTTMRRHGTAEPSNATVAAAITEQLGVPISHTYIWQLRTGRRDNPSIQHLTALATYFGVPVAYFLDDEESARIERDLELLSTLRENGVTDIALRAADLSQESRDAVSDLITRLLRLENRRD
ncbi:helix-turn-helix domain-containing protein [Actinophytocola sp.]|uniref:helix-turn-helix domain-containing protein n=1 Tax=Actinophytocola sp. TaxID=1872138 RepID=UPI00389AD3E2